MLRKITGFNVDEVGDFVADLSCLHAQHVRHSPPFRDRPWVTTPEGRVEHVGTMLDCPLCDRADVPEGLRIARTAGPFDDQTLPPGLRSPHRIAEATWGALRVERGSVELTIDSEPPIHVMLQAGDSHAIPPTVTHLVRLHEAIIRIEFLTR